MAHLQKSLDRIDGAQTEQLDHLSVQTIAWYDDRLIPLRIERGHAEISS